MKIDFSQQFVMLDGRVINDELKQPLTLKTVASNGLLSDQQVDGTEKFARYQLAQKIHGATEGLDLTVEDVAKLKDVIGKVYPPMISGQAWLLLEGNTP